MPEQTADEFVQDVLKKAKEFQKQVEKIEWRTCSI